MVREPDRVKRNRTQRHVIQRHVVFFGETGSGKSSAINLLLGPGTRAPVSNDSHPCTQTSTRYETWLDDTKYNLWDTRGLGEARNLFQFLIGGGSEKELKMLLKERHCRREIDLLVYCVRGSRATEASVKYYNTFCDITRRLAAPIAIVVTQLEKLEAPSMEDWWTRNSHCFEELEMRFDDHACITTLPGHPRQAESREKLAEMITRDRPWKARGNGESYFGSPVKNPTTPMPIRGGGIWGLFKSAMGSPSVGDSRSDGIYPASFTSSRSATDSTYYTANADSPARSTPPSPIVESPTSPSTNPSVQVSRINTLLGAGDSPQPPGEEPSSGSSLNSMFNSSPHDSCTPCSEVYPESCSDENNVSSELPFKYSTATVRRKKSWASRSGAFGDIWECNLILAESSRLVAVKAMRTNTNNHKDLEKKLHRELKVWGKLRHRNIVPLLGVVSGFGPLPSMVSPWFRSGSLSHYLAQNQISMARKQRLIGDIAAGLCYVHDQDVVHGDLHSDNILIDDDGTACLTDFGLSFISDFIGTSYLKSSICGVVHFADPALVERACNLQAGVCYPTKPCDIYSFGGLMLHVLSGKKPYDGIASPTVFVTVLKGERPQIPKHIPPWHKSLIQACWDPEEIKRPLAEVLVKKFDRQLSASKASS